MCSESNTHTVRVIPSRRRRTWADDGHWRHVRGHGCERRRSASRKRVKQYFENVRELVPEQVGVQASIATRALMPSRGYILWLLRTSGRESETPNRHPRECRDDTLSLELRASTGAAWETSRPAGPGQFSVPTSSILIRLTASSPIDPPMKPFWPGTGVAPCGRRRPPGRRAPRASEVGVVVDQLHFLGVEQRHHVARDPFAAGVGVSPASDISAQ